MKTQLIFALIHFLIMLNGIYLISQKEYNMGLTLVILNIIFVITNLIKYKNERTIGKSENISEKV
jgi:hypothetical protein